MSPLATFLVTIAAVVIGTPIGIAVFAFLYQLPDGLAKY